MRAWMRYGVAKGTSTTKNEGGNCAAVASGTEFAMSL